MTQTAELPPKPVIIPGNVFLILQQCLDEAVDFLCRGTALVQIALLPAFRDSIDFALREFVLRLLEHPLYIPIVPS
jgi:hypothetical protein